MRAAKQDRLSKDEEGPLSVICNSGTDNITERNQNHLLRPIFINGVEVGFAYAQGENSVKKLSVRGITITLWYFISRGHQAQALLPFCFKSYPDKCDCWDELMALYHSNLIEFTPGFGSEKYVEVNRILATRAREYGGCMVARSQMHIIVEQNPLLDRTVENKLLMPSFNKNDIIFPVDGPLGRNGITLADTLICAPGDPEWPRCDLQQMNFDDQRIWMNNLAGITQCSQWLTVAEKVSNYQPVDTVSNPSEPSPFEVPPLLQQHPPGTNPLDNRGFSKLRCRPRRSRGIFDDESYQRSGFNNNIADHFASRRKSWTSNQNFYDENYYFVPSYRRNPHRFDEKRASYIGRPNSIYRLNDSSSFSSSTCSRNKRPISGPKLQSIDNLNRLASVFGYGKAKLICDRNPDLAAAKDSLSKLAHLALKEAENDDKQKSKDAEELLKHVQSFAPPLAAMKHPTKKIQNAAKAICDDTEREPVSDGCSGAISSIVTSKLPLMEKAVICNDDDDDGAEPIIVGTAGQDNDLIYFSDSESEIEDDHPLCGTEMMM